MPHPGERSHCGRGHNPLRRCIPYSARTCLSSTAMPEVNLRPHKSIICDPYPYPSFPSFSSSSSFLMKYLGSPLCGNAEGRVAGRSGAASLNQLPVRDCLRFQMLVRDCQCFPMLVRDSQCLPMMIRDCQRFRIFYSFSKRF